MGEFFTDLAAKKKKEGGKKKKKLKGVDALSAHSTARAQRRASPRALQSTHAHSPPRRVSCSLLTLTRRRPRGPSSAAVSLLKQHEKIQDGWMRNGCEAGGGGATDCAGSTLRTEVRGHS